MLQRLPRGGVATIISLLVLVLWAQRPFAVQPPGDVPDAEAIVWHAPTAAIVDRETLHRALTQADYLILGEIHDNPRHHRIQAELLGEFADSVDDNKLAVGFEQLSLDQKTALDTYLQQSDADAQSLGDAVQWQASGWPDYAIYRPLFAATLQRNLPVIPLMHSADATREIMQDGSAAVLPATALERLRPDTLLDREQTAVVEREMQQSHCGKLPAAMLPAMVNVQIARDAFMAYAAVEAANRAVIITGNGHARRDRGIPRFLQRLRPDARIVVVTLLEAAQDTSPEMQASRRAGENVTDFAIITPPQPREDPCLAFQ